MIDLLNIEVLPQTITNNDIVFFGCSFTDNNCKFVNDYEMYTSIMAKHYNKNLINLAKGGHGNYRSFDLFGQLKFTDEETIVVLQLTELSRIRWYNNQIVDQMLSNDPNRSLLTVYNDKFLIYDLIRQLRILVNFCRAQKLKLVIWSIARFWDSELDDCIEKYLSKFPEYIFMNNRLNEPDSYRVDNGTDGINQQLGAGHPGPNSNKLIAKKLIDHLTKIYK